ncbi:hypothetical protein ACH5RR_009077 [Cinchona calisaya]|uniref:Uncharacterized protein n=1 Tax=Cinchona calisaya TaxID=153742 RepID=A0ABD3AH05_9GENT
MESGRRMEMDLAQVYSRPTEAPLCPGNLLRERRGEVKEQARDGFYKFVNDMRQLDLHAGDSRAGRPASDVEEDDERQQALEAIKSSRNAEKKLVTSRFSSFPGSTFL